MERKLSILVQGAGLPLLERDALQGQEHPDQPISGGGHLTHNGRGDTNMRTSLNLETLANED